jgi:threonine dehydrogenase-like Zn-dependent dehydrogenase
MKELKGISASPGIAVGRAFLFTGDDDLMVPRYLITAGQVAGEWGRLETAVEVASAEVTKLRDQTATEMGEEQSKIFDAHIMIEGFRMALGACRFSGRLIVGSWYGAGARQKTLDAFDTVFHRNRVRIIPSQVSTIDPALSARWTHERRLESAWQAIRVLRPSRLITHRIPFSRAGDAYRLIADSPGATIQVMLAHGDGGSLRRCP